MAPRHLTKAEIPQAGLALAHAFADDPMVTWFAGDSTSTERVARSAEGFFAPCLAAGLRRGHTYLLGDSSNTDAVAVWSPPDVEMLDDPDVELLGAAVYANYGEDVMERLLMLGALTAENHPHDTPHFYLFLLGAVTRGRGAGGNVMAPVLERCDAVGVGAYLESSNPRNVGFYERLGFEITWEAAPEPGGPLISGMWRTPRATDYS